MKIATWNVNGIRARKDQVEQFVRAEQPDVVCLQELKALPGQIPDPLRDLAGYHCFWHGMKAYSGVALLVKTSVAASRPEFYHPPFDFESRVVMAQVGGIEIASVYVPNGGKDFDAKTRFLEALRGLAASVLGAKTALVICGDINVTRADIDVHPSQRKADVVGQRPDERALLSSILDQGLHDVLRDRDPENDHLFTWWAPWRGCRERDIGWRLDYLLASEDVAPRISSCRAHREIGTSDHGPVIATID